MVSRKEIAMWKEGVIGIPVKGGEDIKAHYWVKQIEEPDESWGINGGRIIKLQIKVDGKTVVNYDRGWDIEPKTEQEKVATYILLKDYN